MKTATDTADREIVLVRIFDAPRERVWKAWADPQQIVNWWGPRGFSTTSDDRSFKAGGVWRHTLIGPDGARYPNEAHFEEIVEPERIVFTNGGRKEGGKGVDFRTTVTFKDLGGKTELTMRQVFPTPEARDFVVKEFGAAEGGKQTFARLAELLACDSKPTLILKRLLAAPRERVWKAWTDPKQFAAWWGPTDFTNPVCELDVRPGGRINVHMKGPDGSPWEKPYPMGGVFLEIVPPERLVFTATAFSDGEGGWLLENHNTVILEDKGGKTELTLKVVVMKSSPEIAEALAGMEEGWSQSLVKLDALVRG